MADGKLWDMYNAPTNGRAVAYNIRDLMAIDERELFNINRYIGHEFRHRVDNFLHRTKLMQRLLDKAYGAKFLSIPDRYPGYRIEYNMKPVQVTINRDLRHAILSHEKFTPDILQQQQSHNTRQNDR